MPAFPILLIATADNDYLSIALLALPLVIAVQFLLSVSLFTCSPPSRAVRDTRCLVGILLLLGFYLSRVFTAAGAIPAASLYRPNPMAHLLDARSGCAMTLWKVPARQFGAI